MPDIDKVKEETHVGIMLALMLPIFFDNLRFVELVVDGKYYILTKIASY